MTERRDHYSYAVYANPSTARTFDQVRFGGPIGELVAAREADVLSHFIGRVEGCSVLDVGTGTGRAALLLAASGASVTGVDASTEMLTVARERAAAEQASVHFVTGDAHALQFADRSFDVVVSLRVLMHTPRWRLCLDELCRVSKDRVVIDYPSSHSPALFQSLWRRARYAMHGSAGQPYRVFFDRQLRAAFEKNGFRVRATQRHFTLPIGFYKLLGSRRVAELSEDALRRAGLTRIFGSPVTVLAERCAPS